MRSTFKVLFYVNGSKEKNGIVPIMGRVTINGSVAQFSCTYRLQSHRQQWQHHFRQERAVAQHPYMQGADREVRLAHGKREG